MNYDTKNTVKPPKTKIMSAEMHAGGAPLAEYRWWHEDELSNDTLKSKIMTIKRATTSEDKRCLMRKLRKLMMRQT